MVRSSQVGTGRGAADGETVDRWLRCEEKSRYTVLFRRPSTGRLKVRWKGGRLRVGRLFPLLYVPY